MSIWQRPVDLEAINRQCKNTLMQALGIHIDAVTEDAVIGSMPVDERTRQPLGLLHGGASLALAETLGSIAAQLSSPPGWEALGMGMDAHHLRAVRDGHVHGRATALRLGRSSQVWNIEIRDAAGEMVCVSRLTVVLRPPRPR